MASFTRVFINMSGHFPRTGTVLQSAIRPEHVHVHVHVHVPVHVQVQVHVHVHASRSASRRAGRRASSALPFPSSVGGDRPGDRPGDPLVQVTLGGGDRRRYVASKILTSQVNMVKLSKIRFSQLA